MSQFPRTQIPGGSILPLERESTLQLPYLQADQRSDVPVSSWAQFSEILTGFGRVASQAIDTVADMTVAEARAKAYQNEIDQRLKQQALRDTRQRASQDLAELRLIHAGNDEGFASAAPTLLQKYDGYPDIQAEILDSMRMGRERIVKSKQDTAERTLQANRSTVIRSLVGETNSNLRKNADAMAAAVGDPPTFLNAAAQDIVQRMREDGLITNDDEYAVVLEEASRSLDSAIGRDLIDMADRRRRDVQQAEFTARTDSLLDSLAPDNVAQSFDVIVADRVRLGDTPEMAAEAASKLIGNNITRYRAADPVATAKGRFDIINKLPAGFVGDTDQAREAVTSLFRREAAEKANSVMGAISGQAQISAVVGQGRFVNPDEAMALWARSQKDPVNEIVDTVLPNDPDPIFQQERAQLRGKVIERIAKGNADLEAYKQDIDLSQAEWTKVQGGIPGADPEKAYDSTNLSKLLNGQPGSESLQVQAMAATEMQTFARWGRLPNKLVTDLANGLRSQNPNAVKWSLNLLETLPTDVHGSVWTQLSGASGQNLDVAAAAQMTLVASQSGQVADREDFFKRYRQAINGYADFVARGDISRSARLPIEQATAKSIPGFTAQDSIDPQSSALYRSLVAFNMTSPVGENSTVDKVASLTNQSLSSWGLKWVRVGRTMSLVKDPTGAIPDWATDQKRVNETGREWMRQNSARMLDLFDRNSGLSDRPYAKGDSFNPEFLDRLQFVPVVGGDLSRGVPFRLYLDGRQIDTFDEDTLESAVLIPDMNAVARSIRDRESARALGARADLALDFVEMYTDPGGALVRGLNELFPPSRNQP